MSVPYEVERADWMEAARCRKMGPELFFAERGQPVHHAKAICNGCPVVDECLSYAERHHITHGIWGALSPEERRAQRRRITNAELRGVTIEKRRRVLWLIEHDGWAAYQVARELDISVRTIQRILQRERAS